MVQEGRWGPMKQTALALSHLVATRFPQDALQIIGFDLARAGGSRRCSWPTAEPEWVQGTNLQHALMLAGRHLRRHPDAEPVVLVVTDGEPTAHLIGADGAPFFHWPPTRRRSRDTVAEVDELTRLRRDAQRLHARRGPGAGAGSSTRSPGATAVGSSPPTSAGSGEYVVADYLRTRRGRR